MLAHGFQIKKQKSINNINKYISFFEWTTPSGNIYTLSIRHTDNPLSIINAIESEYREFQTTTYIMTEIYKHGEFGRPYHIPTLTADADAIKQCLKETVKDLIIDKGVYL